MRSALESKGSVPKMRLKKKMRAVKSLIQAKLYKRRTPLIVGWSITNRCNSRCKYCNAWDMKSEELQTRQIFSVIEELSRLGTLKIQFTGGEPLLREDLGQIIDFCKEKGIITAINSSGSLFAKKINELKNLNLLCLSLDGPEPTHDYLRGEGSYRGVMEALDVARRNNIKIRFTTVLSKVNLDDVDFILAKGEEFKAYVLFQPATTHLLRSNNLNPMVSAEEEYKRIISDLLIKKKKSKYLGNSVAGLRHLYNWPKKTQIRCWKGLIACRIESNGDVYICPREKGKMRPINCGEKNFKIAFYNLPFLSCDSCWCAANVEVNFLLSVKLSTILNAAKLI